MKNYTNDYGEDIPGNGNMSFDKETLDVVVTGFMNSKQIAEHRKEELDKLYASRKKYRNKAKKATSKINKLKRKINE